MNEATNRSMTCDVPKGKERVPGTLSLICNGLGELEGIVESTLELLGADLGPQRAEEEGLPSFLVSRMAEQVSRIVTRQTDLLERVGQIRDIVHELRNRIY